MCESIHMCEWDMPLSMSHTYMWIRCVTRTARADGCGTLCMSHITHMNESCHTRCVQMAEAGAIDALQSLTEVCIYVTWLLHIHDMTHSYVYTRWCGSISYWGSHIRDMTRAYHDMIHSYVYTSWCMPISYWCPHLRDMTHSYSWHDSFICDPLTRFHSLTEARLSVKWLIHIHDITH